MKGLHCYIIEGKRIGNCSNGGMSSKVDTVTLLGIHRLDGTFEKLCNVFEPDEKAPPVIIEERNPYGSKIYYSAYPCDDEGKKLEGWYMDGGTWIESSDSRFSFDYPVPFHDRQE